MAGISFLCVDSAILQVFEDYYGLKADLSNDRSCSMEAKALGIASRKRF